MYAKLFTSIYQGTLRGDSHGLLVFTNLIAHADSAGHVDIHPRAIADEVGLTLEQVRAALLKLEAPDEESRSPELEGRRIVRLNEHRDWGWQVVNYLKYRAIRDEEDRREQNRLAQQRWRERQQGKSTVSEISTVSRDKPIQKKRERQEAEEEGEAIHGGKPPCDPPAPTALSGKPARKRASKPDTGSVWDAYSQAYAEKYGVQPVRNAKVNGQLSQLVSRLGADEAPGVARSYIASRNGLYVASKHCVDLLLRDCEKLRTEWVTGNVGHQRDAREEDRMSATSAMAQRITATLEAKGVKL